MEPPGWIWEAARETEPGKKPRLNAHKLAILAQLFLDGEEMRDAGGARVVSTRWVDFTALTGYSERTLDLPIRELEGAGILTHHRGRRGGAPATWTAPVASPLTIVGRKRKAQDLRNNGESAEQRERKSATSDVQRGIPVVPQEASPSQPSPHARTAYTTTTKAPASPPPPNRRAQILQALAHLKFQQPAEFVSEHGDDWDRLLAALQRYQEEEDRREQAGTEAVKNPAGWLRNKLGSTPALAFDGGDEAADNLLARLLAPALVHEKVTMAAARFRSGA